MKFIILTLLTMASTHSFAEDIQSKQIIESSSQYRAKARQERRLGVTTTCQNYKVEGSVDLKSSAPRTTMVTQMITADCVSLPADFPLEQKLLALVTHTTDHAKKKTEIRVESIKTIVTSIGLD